MLEVFFTVDVEIWSDGWQDIDERFPEAFPKYICGPASKGCFGLPYTLDLVQHHGLTGAFIIEPLVSGRFGPQPLAEIAGLIRESAQEAQLHLHAVWVDQSREPLLELAHTKRQHRRHFTLDDRLLDQNRDSFCVRGFAGLTPQITAQQPAPLTSPLWRTGEGMLQQPYRRKFA